MISDCIVQWTMLKTILEDKRFCKKSYSVKELIEPKIYDTFHINFTELAKRIESSFAFGSISQKRQWTLNGMLCPQPPDSDSVSGRKQRIKLSPHLIAVFLFCNVRDRLCHSSLIRGKIVLQWHRSVAQKKNARTAALEYKKDFGNNCEYWKKNEEKQQIHKSISCCLHWRFYIKLELWNELWNEQYQLQPFQW